MWVSVHPEMVDTVCVVMRCRRVQSSCNRRVCLVVVGSSGMEWIAVSDSLLHSIVNSVDIVVWPWGLGVP